MADGLLIAQISDTHIQAANPESKARLGDLARTVRSINALPRKPDLVIHSGDVAHDATAADYAAARAELARLTMPVYATVGNRDRRDPFFEAFRPDGYLPAEHHFAQYAVEVAGLAIIAIDTFDDQSALGGFCSRREAILKRLLADATGRPTLVFAHHPPLELPDMKPPLLQYRDVAEARSLADCLAGHAGLVGVIAGHVHRARSVRLGAVSLSTVPSIAADLSREKVAETYLRRPIYHLHTVSSGGMTTQTLMLDSAEAAAA
ncbi:MAG: metallophosphoesterase [Hyphomicrobiaceae bacterium]|nr:metallophosphoesterase [Hyphomicrobiaceae bacterium]